MKSFKGGTSGPIVCYSVTVNVDYPNLAAQTGAYQDIAIPANPGCVIGQRAFINPTLDFAVGYTLGDCRVSAANTFRVQCINCTAGAINPGPFDQNMVFFGAIGAV